MSRAILVSMLVASAAVARPCGSPTEAWFRCRKDGDCAVVGTSCPGWTAVGKRWAGAYRLWAACTRAVKKCAPAEDDAGLEAFVATCEAGACFLAKKKPAEPSLPAKEPGR